MVNPESPTFRFFEKVGYFSGRLFRIIVLAYIVQFLGQKLDKFLPTGPKSQPKPKPKPKPKLRPKP